MMRPYTKNRKIREEQISSAWIKTSVLAVLSLWCQMSILVVMLYVSLELSEE